MRQTKFYLICGIDEVCVDILFFMNDNMLKVTVGDLEFMDIGLLKPESACFPYNFSLE